MYQDTPITDFLHLMLMQVASFENSVKEQFQAASPVTIYGQTHNTEIWIRGRKEHGTHGAFKFKYDRVDLVSLFRGITPYIYQVDDKTLLESMSLQFQIELDQEELVVQHLGDQSYLIKPTEGSCQYVGEINVCFVSDVLSGEPADAPETSLVREASLYAGNLSFLTLGVLSTIKPGLLNAEGAATVAKALTMETLDPWKNTKRPGPYNLAGAKVISNGSHSFESSRGDLMLVIELNPEQCNNIHGQFRMFYSIPNNEE